MIKSIIIMVMVAVAIVGSPLCYNHVAHAQNETNSTKAILSKLNLTIALQQDNANVLAGHIIELQKRIEVLQQQLNAMQTTQLKILSISPSVLH